MCDRIVDDTCGRFNWFPYGASIKGENYKTNRLVQGSHRLEKYLNWRTCMKSP